jgi:thiol-disulfide isomerase/thioredoxin
MKRIWVGLWLAATLAVHAATPTNGAPDAAAPTLPASSSSASALDKINSDFEALRKSAANDPEAKKKMILSLFAEAKDFIAKYPDDTHTADVTMLWAQLGDVMGANHLDGAPPPAEITQTFDRLAANPKVSKPQRAEIRALQISSAIQRASATPADSAQWDDIETRFDGFEKEFGADYSLNGHPVFAALRNMELSALASSSDQARFNALIKKLSASSDPQIAAMAKQAQNQQQHAADLKSKPLDLKYTAVDGTTVDLSKMRGKVVLVDFWATWCGPCVGEVPNVVAAYQKYHGKGFEIVGVSLDQDKEAMLAFTKEHGMMWPQYFDGKGWDNAISKGYGIDSIPAMWLVDKKGMVATTDGRDDLSGQVEKLLAAP